MTQHLESKTVVGLLLLLAVMIGLTIFGKLTPEAVDGLKWIGGTYFAVRTAANVAENLPGTTKE
jgi:threonine/homoserine/homoserine lactone efflux protein